MAKATLAFLILLNHHTRDYEIRYRITYTWEGTADTVTYEWFTLPDGNYPSTLDEVLGDNVGTLKGK